ncbi:MAG: M15 family metallopeptidase [Balneolaceae bacterium]
MSSKAAIIISLVIFLFAVECTKVDSKQKTQHQMTNWDSLFTSQGLVKVSGIDSTILIDLRYSTTNNFTGKDIYGTLEEAYLQPEAMEKLEKASSLLKEGNPHLRLMIYDAARPRSVQQILWDVVDLPENEKSTYVANPKTGSIHNYGCAIDLTISDLDGNELDMGTDYDDFSEIAHINQEEQLIKKGELNETQVKNRRLLRQVMTDAGFQTIRSEWWHFDAFPREKVEEDFVIVE